MYYRTMHNRKAQLESKSISSFDWVWQSPLASWLISGIGIFWVLGKPGSGKSTLMNYLVRANKLHNFLPPRKAPWLVIEFYFDFRAGTSIANTPQGMLRSLLLQLVNEVDCIRT